MDDASIIELFRQRDESAVGELRRKYERLCLYIAGNVLSQREDIEECVNSAYYEVWNNIPPASPDDLKSYLCRIVRNIAINRLEYNSAAKRDSRLAVSLDEIGDCVPATPDENITLSDLADAISRFLREQDDTHRRVFVRRYTYGDSLADIARRYSLNEKTVATYLFRTRKKLKEFLKKEGYDYE
ncbi:MAG: sigma-70 family RNA polymerase sigma factor [Ruminococcus sp.]|nr:sigma-70 family RNA polymerase sigma factor [Ruminococcus sp.]